MKILHCADVHLGSVLEASLTQARAKERRNELMLTFSEMIRFAEREKVQAVIIAGDLSDAKDVPPRTVDHAFRLMEMAEGITFFYLRGNHDEAPVSDVPANVDVAPRGGDWIYYSLNGFHEEPWNCTEETTAKVLQQIQPRSALLPPEYQAELSNYFEPPVGIQI